MSTDLDERGLLKSEGTRAYDDATALAADVKAKLARLAILPIELSEDDWRRIRGMQRQIESVESSIMWFRGQRKS